MVDLLPILTLVLLPIAVAFGMRGFREGVR